VRNPISLARRILDDGRHSLYAGPGALERARVLGVPLCEPADLVTERRQKQLEAHAGTVGAVALDRAGTIAAATSTGGTSGKLPGRVGDSALIGCGTYAESTLAGVSCTGDGEAIIRVALARHTIEILKGVNDPVEACDVALSVLVEEGRGDGGLILVDWRGRMAWAHSTPFMPVGLRSPMRQHVADPDISKDRHDGHDIRWPGAAPGRHCVHALRLLGDARDDRLCSFAKLENLQTPAFKERGAANLFLAGTPAPRRHRCERGQPRWPAFHASRLGTLRSWSADRHRLEGDGDAINRRRSPCARQGDRASAISSSSIPRRPARHRRQARSGSRSWRRCPISTRSSCRWVAAG
jgi:hypothetical protein